MKKINYFFAILCLIVGLSHNPIFAQINISLGAKAGMNASWIGSNGTPQNTSSDGFLFGYTGGIWSRINFSDAEESGFFVQPELVLSQMGSKSVTNNNSGISTIKITNSNIFNLAELPILAGYRLNILDNFDLRFYGGPVFSRVLNAKNKVKNEASAGNSTASSEKTQDITEDVKPYWTSIQIGVGTNINRFNIDVRFQRVLTSMYMSSTNDDSRAMAFQLTLGYKIF